MPDDKVKAQFEKVEVSVHLGIDSPMVIWHTDLETLGLGGGSTSGTGTGTDTGPVSGGGEAPPPRPVAQSQFVATCDAVQHPPGNGVFEGRWFGVVSVNYDEARASADQHEDGLAYVAIYVSGVMVGPVTRR